MQWNQARIEGINGKGEKKSPVNEVSPEFRTSAMIDRRRTHFAVLINLIRKIILSCAHLWCIKPWVTRKYTPTRKHKDYHYIPASEIIRIRGARIQTHARWTIWRNSSILMQAKVVTHTQKKKEKTRYRIVCV